MTRGLSAKELAQIRADIAGLLPDTCDILAVTRTSDGAGSWTEVWGTATADVPCRLDFTCRLDFRSYGKEVNTAYALTPYKSGIISMEYDETITTANRILLNSVEYNITGVNDNQSWIGVKRVSVERVP